MERLAGEDSPMREAVYLVQQQVERAAGFACQALNAKHLLDVFALDALSPPNHSLSSC